MTNPSNSAVQNLLPVQAYFDAQDNFVTFIGQGKPFYATVFPDQSGLNITNSTINSTTIGLTTPAAGAFTSFSTNTGTVATQPVGATDIVNLLALQSYAAGISWKQPCAVGTLGPITLSGLQTIDGYTTLAGDRVLVKNQASAADNGIYLASATAWTRSLDADQWNDFVSAISFLEYGTQAGGAWFCTAVPGGTLGVTPLNWSQFTTSATYSAGTGLTLTGTVFSITPIGTANTYGSATQIPVFTTNASGQVTAVTNTTVTPALASITGFGTGVATALAINTGAAGSFVVNGGVLGTPSSGTMTNVTGLPLTTGVTGTLPIGNGGTGQITASAAFNALSPITTTGDLIIGTGVNTASRLGIGTNNQVLTSNGTTASWVTPSPSTTFSAGTTGFTPNTPSSGAVTLAGTLIAANGGTGFASYTVGDILYASTTTVLSKLAGVATGNALISGGVGAAPSYGKIDLTTTVSGILPGANGGTGNGFFAVSGPATSLKTFTFPNASATVLTDNALVTVAQGGTGVGTLTGLAYGNGTSAFTAATAAQVVAVISTTAVTNATNAVNTGTTDDTTTNATMYPVWKTSTSGNLPEKTSSTKLSFNPSTGTLTATAFAGDGSALTGVGGFPSGTRLIFAQNTAPTGWTKDTTNYNNHALRVVTGTASTGGTVDFTTAFASQTPAGSVSTSITAVAGSVTISGGSVAATTLSTAQMPSHNHKTGIADEVNPWSTNAARYGYADYWTSGNVRISYNTGGQGCDTYSQTIGSSSSHTHTFTTPTGSFGFTSGTASSSFTGTAINLAVKYLDVITATKN
jgi:hypothetical protein